MIRGILHLALSLLDDPAERRLGQQDSEIERLRCQLADERRDLDAVRREADKTIGRIVRERDEVIARLNKAHDEKEVARLRDELAVERRRYAFAAAHWGAADIDALRAERDAARAMLTPRVYEEGDRPRLPEMVLYRTEGVWAPLHRDCLRPGDLWIPMPPPPDEDKR